MGLNIKIHRNIIDGVGGSEGNKKRDLVAAVRLIIKPELWNYSNAASHVHGKEDVLLSRTLLLNEMIDDWNEFLSLTAPEQDIKMLQQHERTGRPLGSERFLTSLKKSLYAN